MRCFRQHQRTLRHRCRFVNVAFSQNRLRSLENVATQVGEASADVRRGLVGPVPAHLRDAHYKGASKLDHGKGYRYAHDFPGGVVGQQYAPDAVAGREYYHPTGHGMEARFTRDPFYKVEDKRVDVLHAARPASCRASEILLICVVGNVPA